MHKLNCRVQRHAQNKYSAFFIYYLYHAVTQTEWNAKQIVDGKRDGKRDENRRRKLIADKKCQVHFFSI